MRFPSRAEYKDYYFIKGKEWRIEFCKFISKGDIGECDEHDRVIRIKTGLDKQELFSTFVHEFLHAVVFEYKIKGITHKAIYTFERALVNFLIDNPTALRHFLQSLQLKL